jgi:hypothetical protein
MGDEDVVRSMADISLCSELKGMGKIRGKRGKEINV